MESWKEQLKSKIHESELSVSEISDKTKIPSKYIDAIQEGKFQDLPAEIFAKSQIERLFKFLKIDPNNALKDYEEFISPVENQDEEQKIDIEEPIKEKLLKIFDIERLKNSYVILGGVFLLIIFSSVFIFYPSDQINDTNLVIENVNYDSLVSEISEVTDGIILEETDKTISLGNTEEKNPASNDISRRIEIIIEGESWIVVFDRDERLLYELMQTGSYEFSGLSPLRFKIGYAPATDLFIDGEKINFARAIKGATNYAHFWINEGNKVESIRD